MKHFVIFGEIIKILENQESGSSLQNPVFPTDPTIFKGLGSAGMNVFRYNSLWATS